MNLESLFSSFESEDDLGVVIRTHIVIENYLRDLIKNFLVDEKYFEATKLEYFQVVQMALAFGLQPRFESSLNALGKLRNKFAHELRDELSRCDVTNFYETLDSNEKQMLQESTLAVHKELGLKVKSHKKLEARQQFINMIALLAAALSKACKEAKG
ncbi:hypothetical protein [Colwellia echini]|uniref:Mannitol repressor n=1 Tax=Colwellia echini TaxID=1982103 RepID=A0ABY3MTM5_9GAMM|nr:hypothetical protein [Colwellia echini]TYK64530.1 hypothetical protein CWS31_015290 [Colwellia echini]